MASSNTEELPTFTDDVGLQNRMKNKNIPGVSFTVLKENVHRTYVYGTTIAKPTADCPPYPILPDTVFQAASLSKPVFAYMVLKAAEQGLIDLDAPLHTLSKKGFGNPSGDYQKDGRIKQLTARLILSHQASLPNESPDAFLADSTPGEQFDYSGLAYCMLSEVLLEVVSSDRGKPVSLEELAQESFAQLGISRTSFLKHKDGSEERKKRAIGHTKEGTPDSSSEDFFREHPAASLVTTSEDYSKFVSACLADPYIKENMFKTEVSNFSEKDRKAIDAGVPKKELSKISWGLGIGLLKDSKGHTIAFHWGDINVSRAFMAVNLDTGISVTLFTNSASGPAIFPMVCEPVGDLTPVWTWLAQREQLPLPTQYHSKTTQRMDKSKEALLSSSQTLYGGAKDQQSPSKEKAPQPDRLRLK